MKLAANNRKNDIYRPMRSGGRELSDKYLFRYYKHLVCNQNTHYCNYPTGSGPTWRNQSVNTPYSVLSGDRLVPAADIIVFGALDLT